MKGLVAIVVLALGFGAAGCVVTVHDTSPGWHKHHHCHGGGHVEVCHSHRHGPDHH